MKQFLKLTVLVIIFSGCNNYKTKYPYSINDFRPELIKDLEKIVEAGIADYYETNEDVKESEKFNKKCSVDDLKKLMQCEHSLIRARAFNLLVKRNSANVENILLASLDDTAIIAVDRGEWGTPMMYCADYYLSEANKKIEWGGILDTLVTKYPNLQTTFTQLTNTDSLPEKYYGAVKSMAINSLVHYKGPFYIDHSNNIRSDILFALSKYKHKDDVTFIKDHLRYSRLYFWKLIQNNPDTAYFSVLKEEYFEPLKRAKKRGPENLQLAFWGRYNRGDHYEDFLVTLAKFKNKESAEMFSEILKERIFPNRGKIKDNEFECLLYDVLKQDSCTEYKTLIHALKPLAESYKTKYQISLEASTIAELRER
jgi:hypothetical protein